MGKGPINADLVTPSHSLPIDPERDDSDMLSHIRRDLKSAKLGWSRKVELMQSKNPTVALAATEQVLRWVIGQPDQKLILEHGVTPSIDEFLVAARKLGLTRPAKPTETPPKPTGKAKSDS